MHAFQRRARHQGVLPRHVEQGGAFHHQERPEALAAIEARIAHGLDQPRRPAQFAVRRRRRQKLFEQGLGIGGDRIEAREKGAVFGVHCVFNQRFQRPCGVLYLVLHLRDNDGSDREGLSVANDLIASMVLAIWLYLLAARGGFWLAARAR